MKTIELAKDIALEAKKYFPQAGGCHGWDHTERVYHLAIHLGKVEGADLEILAVAALLHDIARKIEDDSNGKICHAEKGAEMAEELLKNKEYDDDFIEKVCHCISVHRFRKNNAPETIEAKILFDADKLDSIGAVGLGRAFQFSGEIGSKLHNNPEDTELEGNNYTEEDTAYNEFIFKLSKLKDKMFTDEGRRLAERRQNFMVDFFEELDREVKGNS